jgi:hypothetical protein
MVIMCYLYEVLVVAEGPHANPLPVACISEASEPAAIQIVAADARANPDDLPPARFVARLAEYAIRDAPRDVRRVDPPPYDWLIDSKGYMRRGRAC